MLTNPSLYLVIDTSVPDQVAFFYGAGTGWREVRSPLTMAADLLAALAEFLTTQKIAPGALGAIGVVGGKDTWTGERVTTTIENTLAFAWHIPIIKLPAGPSTDWLVAFRAAAPGQYVLPVYTGDLRLTI